MRGAMLAMALLAAGAAQAGDVAVRVDQITDVSATAATGMFRFEPDLVRIDPGDAVVFLNSRGEHTVHSIEGIWPAPTPPVAIHNTPELRIPFEVPGLYALRCARHGRYGMVMLVVVGAAPDPDAAKQVLAAAKLARGERKRLEALIARLGAP